MQGKTASLFQWAMFAGGRAGGVGTRECEALESYGGMLGLAFQIVDDAPVPLNAPHRAGPCDLPRRTIHHG